MDNFTRIGDAPRPSSSQELGRRIRDELLTQLTADPGSTALGIENVRVDVTMHGASIDALLVDASGVAIDIASDTTQAHLPAAGVDDGADDPAVASRESAVLRRGTFAAHPLRIQHVSLDLEATAVNVPFEWLELDDGGLALGIPEEMNTRSRRAVRLHLRVAVNPDDVFQAIMRVLRADIADLEGAHIDRERFSFTQLRARRFRIELSARVRWKFLRPTLRTSIELQMDNRFVVRLRRVKITSSNPLLMLVLRVFRRRITRDIRKPIDLKEHLRPLALRSLTIHSDGTRVVVEGEAGLL